MITIYPICGVCFGFQFTEGETEEGIIIDMLLIDLFIFTLQFTWVRR